MEKEVKEDSLGNTTKKKENFEEDFKGEKTMTS